MGTRVCATCTPSAAVPIQTKTLKRQSSDGGDDAGDDGSKRPKTSGEQAIGGLSSSSGAGFPSPTAHAAVEQEFRFVNYLSGLQAREAYVEVRTPGRETFLQRHWPKSRLEGSDISYQYILYLDETGILRAPSLEIGQVWQWVGGPLAWGWHVAIGEDMELGFHLPLYALTDWPAYPRALPPLVGPRYQEPEPIEGLLAIMDQDSLDEGGQDGEVDIEDMFEGDMCLGQDTRTEQARRAHAERLSWAGVVTDLVGQSSSSGATSGVDPSTVNLDSSASISMPQDMAAQDDDEDAHTDHDTSEENYVPTPDTAEEADAAAGSAGAAPSVLGPVPRLPVVDFTYATLHPPTFIAGLTQEILDEFYKPRDQPRQPLFQRAQLGRVHTSLSF